MKLYHFTFWLGLIGEVLAFTALWAVIVAEGPIDDSRRAEETACVKDQSCDLAKLQWHHEQERVAPSPLRSASLASLIGVFVFVPFLLHGVWNWPGPSRKEVVPAPEKDYLWHGAWHDPSGRDCSASCNQGGAP